MKLAYKNIRSGFSLIELMVVIAIMAIIASISLFNQSKFTSDLAITNLAYEVALTIREAQVFGGSVKEAGGGNFSNAYGVHFNVATDNKKFISFVDSGSPGNKVYDGTFSSCSGECTTIHQLGRGNSIKEICRDPIVSNSGCPSGRKENSVDITFLRPNLDARIKFPGGGQNSDGKEVYIVLSASDETIRVIKVQQTGQIAVLN